MKIKLLVAIFFIFFLSGCRNYRELDDMAIVGLLGIDYDMEKKEFISIAQIFNAKKNQGDGSGSSSSQKSPVTVYEGRGKTLHESLRNITLESPRKLYIGHIEVVVFSEVVAKDHFIESLDFLFRDNESRKDFDVVLIKDAKMKEVLEILTPLENIPSNSIKKGIKANEITLGTELSLSYDRLLYYLYGSGVEPILPVLTIVGEVDKGKQEENTSFSSPPADLIYSGTAVFKDNKLIGYLNNEESFGVNLIIGNVESSVISFSCDDNDNYAAIELNGTSSKIKTEVKDNNVKGIVNINIKASLSEVNCNYNLRDQKKLAELNKLAVNRVQHIVNSAIKTVQDKYQSDVLGFGAYLYHNNNGYWKKNENNWDQIFSTMKVKTNIKIDMANKGSATTSVMEVKNDKKG